MKRWLLTLLLALPLPGSVMDPPPLEVVIVVGAPGSDLYKEPFETAGQRWLKAAAAGGKQALLISEKEGGSQLEVLNRVLAAQAAASESPLWLVFIGHGTFDGSAAKFNLHGPDISASELAALISGFQRPFVLLNTTSSSAPFLNALSGPNRIIITATKSGWEENYARFGEYLAETIADRAADLDKDGQTSLLEAFLMASRRVEEFYRTEQRLATEHAILDDNGDALGTSADFFQGVRATRKPEEEGSLPDGLRAHQLHLVPGDEEARLPPEAAARRNELEIELEKLRAREGEMPESAYLAELEKILVEISRIYHPREAAGEQQPSAPPKTDETTQSPAQ